MRHGVTAGKAMIATCYCVVSMFSLPLWWKHLLWLQVHKQKRAYLCVHLTIVSNQINQLANNRPFWPIYAVRFPTFWYLWHLSTTPLHKNIQPRLQKQFHGLTLLLTELNVVQINNHAVGRDRNGGDLKFASISNSTKALIYMVIFTIDRNWRPFRSCSTKSIVHHSHRTFHSRE